MFQIWGWKKKGKHLSMGKDSQYSLWDTPVTYGASTNAPNAVFIGWAACTIFDFKGCVDCMQDLCFFPAENGPVEVPIKTTLSNTTDPLAARMGIVLAPDLVLNTDSATPRVRIVHSMPSRNEPIEGDQPG